MRHRSSPQPIDENLNLATKNSVCVRGKGKITIRVADQKMSRDIDLDNALLVPDLRTNLIQLPSENVANKISENNHDLKIWQERLGHLNEKDLKAKLKYQKMKINTKQEKLSEC
ncbi:hypothetical protein PV325_008329 [Microctonus aethiopoides]|nr:hypothetical protein PV326_013319 [Microctonus aethiopoides]KAK0074440.1 hypothetical protein PV325_008329 [Microctonus aethiopoides]